ncbi:hypothetical protein GCM10023063_21140 [Arthrobacter methylotrophus]|uniref:hypothetical protein n=1 Tax=Arthrobacter methylotrophus TaxID=121291 RepID=UPI0031E7AB87
MAPTGGSSSQPGIDYELNNYAPVHGFGELAGLYNTRVSTTLPARRRARASFRVPKDTNKRM